MSAADIPLVRVPLARLEATETARLAHPTICPRCKRVAVGWPLRRADVCAPKGWAHCLREPDRIKAKALAKEGT